LWFQEIEDIENFAAYKKPPFKEDCMSPFYL